MDPQIRLAAFTWLEQLTLTHGDVLPWNVLNKGFDFKGERIIPIGATGIWKPRQMDLPLSITTSPNSPYNDKFSMGEFLIYDYRGTDPYHKDNSGLREIMKQRLPLIYFLGVSKGNYLAAWPVYIVNDSISELSFTVAVDDFNYLTKTGQMEVAEEPGIYSRRKYITSKTLIRLHQRSFRERVLLAYQNQCALCHLRHRELLDAAHIIGDREDNGEPIIQNGLSLCKIHHAAFDQNIIGINPDYQVKVRKDILKETDGPMLRYGIQELDNKILQLPKNKINWTDKNRLDLRYQSFLKAV
jgi:putative restriction endonuclease